MNIIIPAQEGYILKTAIGWIPVIAWAFDGHCGTPTPITVVGAPRDEDGYEMRLPDGQIRTVEGW